MIKVIPEYGLRAYALFYTRHGPRESFKQSELDWIVGSSMKKKIFALLLQAGWIKKKTRATYMCVPAENVIRGMMEFRVAEVIKKATKPYAFTNLSAIEIYSDYAYIQRGIEKSPYFIKIFKKDIAYWKDFLNKGNIPNYINYGSTIGEYVILIPEDKINPVFKDGLFVEPLKTTMKMAKKNEMFSYAYSYMRKKYGTAA